MRSQGHVFYSEATLVWKHLQGYLGHHSDFNGWKILRNLCIGTPKNVQDDLENRDGLAEKDQRARDGICVPLSMLLLTVNLRFGFENIWYTTELVGDIILQLKQALA